MYWLDDTQPDYLTLRPRRCASLPALTREWLTLDDTGWLARLERQGCARLLRKIAGAWPVGVEMPAELRRVLGSDARTDPYAAR